MSRLILNNPHRISIERAALEHVQLYAPTLVLTPNVAAGRSLRARVPGVQTRTIGQVARDHLERHGWRAFEPGQALWIVSALLGSDLGSEPLGSEPLEFLSGVKDRLSTAHVVLAAIREFARSALEPAALLAAAASPRARDLARLYSDFLEDARRLRRFDSATAELLSCDLLAPVPLLAHGFAYFDAAQVQFVNALAADGSAITLPMNMLSVGSSRVFTEAARTINALERFGWKPVSLTGEAESVGEHLAARFAGFEQPQNGLEQPATCSRHATPEVEVRDALSRIRALLADGVPAREIAVVTRDEGAYLPTLEAVSREYGLPLTSGQAVTLAETSVGSWLAVLLRANLERFPYLLTQRLLADPLAVGARSDLAVWALARRAPKGLRAWHDFADPDALAALELPAEASQEEFAQRTLDALGIWGIASRGVALRQTVAFNLMARALREIGREKRRANAREEDRAKARDFGRDDGETITLEVFAERVSVALESNRVPRLLSKAGVRVHTPLALLGRTFGYVFVLGLNEGIFPARANENPLLDSLERRRLVESGVVLPTLETRSSLERALFHAALSSATKGLHLSFAARSGSDAAQQPSSFLRGLNLSTAAPIETPVSPREALLRQALAGKLEASDGALAMHAMRVASIEEHRNSDANSDAFDGVLSAGLSERVAMPWSASQLQTLGSCRFKWFARKPLGLEPLPVPPREVEATATGSLYHAALEHAAKRAKDAGQKMTVDAIMAQLKPAFEQGEHELRDELEGSYDWSRERFDHLHLLERAIRGEDFTREDRELVNTELTFSADTTRFTYSDAGESISLSGRIDRIDVGDQRFEVIDYKLGEYISKVRSNDALGATLGLEIQLTLYLTAGFEAVGLAGLPELFGMMPSKARYYSLRGAKTLLERGPEAPLGKKDISWEEQLSRTRSFVESAMRDVARGYFPPIPDERLEACHYCDYASLCRVSRPRIVAKIAANRKAARLAKHGFGQVGLENLVPEIVGAEDAASKLDQP